MAVFFKKDKHVFVQLNSSDDWDKFYEICEGYITRSAFELIRQYLNNVARTIVIEKDYVDADYRDTYFNFFSRKFSQYPSKTIRANFFIDQISPRMLFELDRFQDEYLGFIVLRPNRVNPIGRTVLDPRKLPFVSGHVCLSNYPIHILGAELTATGFPYISQDTDVTVCAHAACWMIFRYFSQRYHRYAEKWPYEVSQLTKDVSTGRLVPSKGLTAYQVTDMFSNFGFSPEIYFRNQYKEIFDQLLYMYVESGLPVVAALSDRSHAITIIGHLSDYGINSPKTPASSDEYLSGFIANDDNFLPYQVIAKNDATPVKTHWSKYKTSEIDAFIVPLYEKIHLSAEHVLKLSTEILKHEDLGLDARSRLLKYDDVVTRTFLTSSKSFKKVRKDARVPLGITKVYCEMAMPKFIWVCEISSAALFEKGIIVGEIIFDATSTPRDIFAFLSIHYPDFFLLNDRDSLTNDPRRFNIHTVDTVKIIPYKCYLNNLCEV